VTTAACAFPAKAPFIVQGQRPARRRGIFFGKQAMFIQTEVTPNPATLKFLPGRAVLESGTLDLRDPEQAAQSPLAERLFGISGISGVFFGSDFIAVTKNGGEWQQLKPMILGAIMEHFMSGEPLIARGEAQPSDGGEFFETADAETVATIKDLIETRVRPAVANDGGDITFRGFKDGVVYLNMKGACSGCPSSTATLRHGIQNLLRHYIPEVTEVRPV
jgi:Fe-S cluster biogenesis protein NfuA